MTEPPSTLDERTGWPVEEDGRTSRDAGDERSRDERLYSAAAAHHDLAAERHDAAAIRYERIAEPEVAERERSMAHAARERARRAREQGRRTTTVAEAEALVGEADPSRGSSFVGADIAEEQRAAATRNGSAAGSR